ncbi:MAG: heme ABC transporter permease [Pseudomonadota bacterium]
MRVSHWLLPVVSVLALVCLAAGLYMAFVTAPPDYQQGQTVRIMFIHVPAAWLAMGIYLLVAISSFGFLVFRHPLADVSATAAVPLGAAFTLICLATGSLWGRPMWGTYWDWDARMTSVLILFFLYLGLMVLRRASDDATASKLTAILAIVGVVLLPIIKFSVDYWNTLHQPASVARLDGPAIDPSMLYPLLVMALAAGLIFFALHLFAMRNEIRARRVTSLLRARVSRVERTQRHRSDDRALSGNATAEQAT